MRRQRLGLLGAALLLAGPAWAQYTIHDGDLPKLFGVVGAVLFGLFVLYVGIPLGLGGLACWGWRLSGRAPGGGLPALGLAVAAWQVGLQWLDVTTAGYTDQWPGLLLLAAATVAAALGGCWLGRRKGRRGQKDERP